MFFFVLFCKREEAFFGFYLLKEKELSPIGERYFFPKRFVRYKPPIYFPSGYVLYYSFFSSSLEDGVPYTVVLFRKSLGWVEERMEQIVLREGEEALVGFFADLPKGEYLLRVYERGRKIGETFFSIL